MLSELWWGREEGVIVGRVTSGLVGLLIVQSFREFIRTSACEAWCCLGSDSRPPRLQEQYKIGSCIFHTQCAAVSYSSWLLAQAS